MATKPSNVTPLKEPPTGLALLRVPFPDHLISKLPKPTKAQTEAVKDDFRKGVRCKLCKAWHHPDVEHLDYVGHAALTDRLLDTDPEWNWEPMGFNPDGTPALDRNGGLWIKLTVCGVTRPGYGAADGKNGGDATKEIIGDALRNAAMRFGAALDLWHKGDLHADDEAYVSTNAGQGQSGESEVSPDQQSGYVGENPPPPSRQAGVKLTGRYTSITALEKAIKEFVPKMDKCGEWGDWVALQAEYPGLLEQAERDHRDWWNGWPDQPDRFVPLARKIELLEATLSQHMANIARS